MLTIGDAYHWKNWLGVASEHREWLSLWKRNHFSTLRFQDDGDEFEVGCEKRDVEHEYKEIIDWLNDVESRASLMEQQWSEEGEEDESKKKRKGVRLKCSSDSASSI